MKVGEKRIYGCEFVSRFDEEIRPAFVCVTLETFEHANGGGANGDDAAAARFGVGDGFGGFFGEAGPFAMHDVFFEGLCFHGTECADADVEGYEGSLDAEFIDAS